MEATTYARDGLVRVSCGKAIVSVAEDKDVPSDDAWSWGIWYDGDFMDGMYPGKSFEDAMKDAVESTMTMAKELETAARELADRLGIEVES